MIADQDLISLFPLTLGLLLKMTIGLTHFSLADKISNWANSYTGHPSIKYYLKHAVFEHHPEFNTICIVWPNPVNGKSIGLEAEFLFPILYEATSQSHQENVFPWWLDDYQLATRYGLTVRPFRSPVTCRNCLLR